MEVITIIEGNPYQLKSKGIAMFCRDFLDSVYMLYEYVSDDVMVSGIVGLWFQTILTASYGSPRKCLPSGCVWPQLEQGHKTNSSDLNINFNLKRNKI